MDANQIFSTCGDITGNLADEGCGRCSCGFSGEMFSRAGKFAKKAECIVCATLASAVTDRGDRWQGALFLNAKGDAIGFSAGQLWPKAKCHVVNDDRWPKAAFRHLFDNWDVSPYIFLFHRGKSSPTIDCLMVNHPASDFAFISGMTEPANGYHDGSKVDKRLARSAFQSYSQWSTDKERPRGPAYRLVEIIEGDKSAWKL